MGASLVDHRSTATPHRLSAEREGRSSEATSGNPSVSRPTPETPPSAESELNKASRSKALAVPRRLEKKKGKMISSRAAVTPTPDQCRGQGRYQGSGPVARCSRSAVNEDDATGDECHYIHHGHYEDSIGTDCATAPRPMPTPVVSHVPANQAPCGRHAGRDYRLGGRGRSRRHLQLLRRGRCECVRWNSAHFLRGHHQGHLPDCIRRCRFANALFRGLLCLLQVCRHRSVHRSHRPQKHPKWAPPSHGTRIHRTSGPECLCRLHLPRWIAHGAGNVEFHQSVALVSQGFY
ncbi:uncharacterized protein LOC142588724 [Dermacentor variabilis]|uniref:uncharacterized protein LOC142588724 n=1 Tax=Dermacentor variabilis TaxID=34621 RepID=UPI003F5B5171